MSTNNPKKVLKLIADWRYGKKPEGTKNWEDIPNEEKDWNSWWYLHGKLEDYVGYDKATATNCKSGGFAKETINWGEIVGDRVTSICDELPTHKMCIDGIVDVEIEGINKPCVGYFWTACHKTIYWEEKAYEFWEQRGLVCFKSDTESCEYAKKMYEKQSQFI